MSIGAIILIVILIILVLTGRLICGWICPLGWLQELIFLIPIPKLKKVPFDKYLRYIKYFLFIVLAILIPFVFIPYKEELETAMLALKIVVFSLVFILSIFIKRPFCKYLCPFGAIGGIFNKFNLVRYEVDEQCISCKICSKKCDMGINPYINPNSAECIRCGKCMKKCPKKSIHFKKLVKKYEKNK